MKRLILIAFTILAVSACDWQDRLDNLENRVTQLEQICSRLNQDISSIREIIGALQDNDYITGIEPVMQGNKEIGYTIRFARAKTITVYHGKDGTHGKDGADGHTPVIGARKDTDGIYYWTVDGAWLADEFGNRLPVTGKDGADGKPGKDGEDGRPGADGKDGVTPQLRIEDGFWYVSADNGGSWQKLGPATGDSGKDGDSFFKEIQVGTQEVTFVLSDGTTFLLPRYGRVAITFDIQEEEACVSAGETLTIHYTLVNSTDNTVVTASSDGQYIVKVRKTDRTGGVIIVKCPDVCREGFINVMVSDNGYSFIRVINFNKNRILFPQGLEYIVGAEGGTLAIPISYNTGYTVKVPPEYASWLSVPARTKACAMQEGTIEVVVAENGKAAARTGKILVYTRDLPDTPYQEIIFRQERPVPQAEKDLVFKVKVMPVNDFTAYLPLMGRIDCSIDWGDGTVESYDRNMECNENTQWIHHKYNVAETTSYEVRISGTVTRLQSYERSWSVPDIPIPSHSVQEVIQWGQTGLRYMDSAFDGNTFLERIAEPDSKSFGKVTSFECTFYGCSSLASVPPKLFAHCPYVTDFSGTFEDCSSLVSIPPELFAHCPNVTSFGCESGVEGTFYDCRSLVSIPPELFAHCPNVTDFSETFGHCSSLVSIPPELFAHCPDATDFRHTFFRCSALTSIPSELFANCPDVTDFSGTFIGCSALTSIPSELFANCPDVMGFVDTFIGCSALTSIPSELFANCPNVTDFRGTFACCSSLASIPPDLFAHCPDVIYFGDSRFDGTFNGCTSLALIPAGLFDHNRKVKDFTATFSECTHLVGESPYTTINGVKYHLYERENNPEEFVAPSGGYYCFFKCARLTDYGQMPKDWK